MILGDGCEGPHGVVRSGKIIITFSGERKEAGSYRTVTLEDYMVDSVALEGIRTVTLVSSDSVSRVVSTSMTGGKVTFPDGTFATRDASKTKTIVRGEDEGDDYSTVSGSASGVKRDGTAYSNTIVEDLLFLRSCRAAGIYVPVSGIKEVTNGDTTASIDYGDGECDNIVSVTVDGETTEETIETRGRKRRR